jgi:signal transduction histidine kinase
VRTLPFAAYFAFLVLVFVVSAGATAAYVQFQSSRDAKNDTRADARFAAAGAAKQLSADLGVLRATVDQLAANPTIAAAIAHPEGCSLAFGVEGDVGQGHLDLVTPRGKVVCSSRKPVPTGYAGAGWLAAAGRKPTERVPYRDPGTGTPMLLYAAPGTKVRVAGFLDLTTLTANLAAVYGGTGHAEFLLLRDGHVLSRSLRPRRAIGRSVTATGERRDLDGTKRLYASAAVPGTPWTLAVGEDEARALAAGNRLRDRELVIALSSLALVLLATLLVYRRIVTPMKQLSDGVKATAAHGRSEPVSVSGPAEVMALAHQINSLTASVNAQEAVRLAKEEAQRANQAKSRFLSHMSHEMRTPLAAILGFAELLRRRLDGEQEREWAQHIEDGGRHLLALINELLEVSRVEAGKLALTVEPVDVAAAVDEVLRLAEPLTVERGVTLESARPGGPVPAVLADPLRLKQVLLNLLSNAIKYNSEGGTVRVSVAATERGTVRVAVADTGAGIAPDALGKLFSPFERLGAEQGAVEGSGLGLVVTKGLVEAMGGRLDVASTLGEGTTFAFELAVEDAAPARGVRPSQPRPDAAVVGDVLYIEDNRTNLQIVDSVLSDLRPGIHLRTATAGGPGAELAAQRRPDLLLLDLNLPDMQGEEVLRRLRARPETADVPIVVLSADSTSRNITRLLDTGADAYLTKPLDLPQFLEAVDRLLAAR